MGIKENPYGVGYSAGEQQERNGRCTCCDLPFKVMLRPNADFPELCSHCRDHREIADEPIGRRVERLEEHDGRLRQHIADIRGVVQKAHRASEDRLEQTRSALRSREAWKAVLAEVRTLHAPDAEEARCECGLAMPCETLVVLDEDTSIKREINTRSYDDLVTRHGRFRDLA